MKRIGIVDNHSINIRQAIMTLAQKNLVEILEDSQAAAAGTGSAAAAAGSAAAAAGQPRRPERRNPAPRPEASPSGSAAAAETGNGSAAAAETGAAGTRTEGSGHQVLVFRKRTWKEIAANEETRLYAIKLRLSSDHFRPE